MENYKITVHDIEIDGDDISNSKILDTSHIVETSVPLYVIDKIKEMFNTFDKNKWSVTELINPIDNSIIYSIIPYIEDAEYSISETPVFHLKLSKENQTGKI